jgi:proteasome lid subunit RPN8/RPN11
LASDPAITSIRLPILLWRRVVLQLRRRGAGTRESGAFLLGGNSNTLTCISDFVCYDDLDADAYETGAITFHAAGYAALWEYCRAKKLEVVADVHTHPGIGVRQSPIDQRNPMVPVSGQTAMIVPNFGQTPWWSLNTVGVYEYLGDFKWRTYEPSQKPRRISLTAW